VQLKYSSDGSIIFDNGLASDNASESAWLAHMDKLEKSFIPDGDVPDEAGKPSSGSSGSVTTTTGTTNSNHAGEYQWSGISFSSIENYYYPPDNGMAANAGLPGHQEVITSENGAVQTTVFTSATTYTQTTENWNSFFTGIPAGWELTDPRVLFDTATGHFIIAVDDINTTTAQSSVLYAVSHSSTPTLNASDWTFFSVSTTHNATWSDQPLITENNGDLYITTNQFTSSGHYSSDYLTIVTNYDSVPTSTSYALDDFSYQPAVNSDGASTTQYFVSHDAGVLHIFGVDGSTVGTEYTLSGLLPEFGNGAFAASQLGSNFKLDAGDGRINSAAYDAAHHQLYAVFEFQPSGGNSTPSTELVQIDMSGATPVIKADISLNSLLPTTGTTQGAATFNASLAIDNNGDLLVNFNVSGSKMYVADYYAEWKAPAGGFTGSTPLGATTAVVDWQNSSSAYVDPSHDATGRWGDYSTVVADASSPNGFYLSNEFDNGTTKIGSHSYSSWGTETAHVLV
jgi:hypothetical protein